MKCNLKLRRSAEPWPASFCNEQHMVVICQFSIGRSASRSYLPPATHSNSFDLSSGGKHQKNQILSAGIAIAALSAAAALNLAIAQKGKGSLYAFHTFAVVGGCPGLDWHVTVSPEDKIGGFVAWDRSVHMARLEGEVNKDRTLEIDAKEVGAEGRSAVARESRGRLRESVRQRLGNAL